MQIKDSIFAGEKRAPVQVDAKTLTEEGEFEGYASVFGERDQGDDVVVAGAFARTLITRPINTVKMLWQHDTHSVIGKWLLANEDSKGLLVRGKLMLAVQKGKECYELMKEGMIDGLSIGYRAKVSEYDKDLDVRRLKEVELREISIVTFPMLETAKVSLVKGDTLPSEREFEQFLMRDAGFTARQAKAIIAGGYKSLTSRRDAASGEDKEVRDAFRNAIDLWKN